MQGSKLLHRYWVEFDAAHLPSSFFFLRLGCGVTAYNIEDALSIIQFKIFQGKEVPPIKSLVSDVDISLLDPDHVLPNMEPPILRGIWFPRGFG